MDPLRAQTDESVLRALTRIRRMTRAELATSIGVSKPTAGESVRRLTERGLVIDTGERTAGGRGKGRVGSYYALSPSAGTALAISIASAGVTAECLDPYGDTIARAVREIPHPSQVSSTLQAAVTEVVTASGVISVAGATPVPLPVPRRPRLAVVSAADPVDRSTGRLVELPDSPFLVGALDPVAVLAPFVDGPVIVDNDVNWAARAERDHAGADFAYLFLGEGLGCAIVNDGEIRRGRGGLAGEIAHVITTGPGGRAVCFTEVFAGLGLRRPGTAAIDVPRLLAACAGPTPARAALAEAVTGVVAAVVALTDPAQILIGGSWGPALIDPLRAAVAQTPRPVPLTPATATPDPPFTGARGEALTLLHAAMVIEGVASPESTGTPDGATRSAGGGGPAG